MTSPKLSISIVHHHGLEMLRNCLDSIFKNSPSFSFEVIVVDNASTDGAVEMMANDFPQVCVIKNAERHGFGHNQNIGINACGGDYVFIYNDDTLVHGDALSCLCEYLDSHPEVSVVGPRLLNKDGTLQMSCYKFPTPLRYVWENLLLTAAFPNNTIFGDYRAWAHDSEREVDFIIGAAMLVRKTAIEKVGLFDESFFMYFEEIDWQLRMNRAGLKIALYPGAIVTHLGGQSSETAKDKQFAEFNSSSVILISKHYGVMGAFIQRVCMLFGSLLRIVAWSMLALVCPEKRERSVTEIKTWKRLLKWWAGLGPHEGLASSVRH